LPQSLFPTNGNAGAAKNKQQERHQQMKKSTKAVILGAAMAGLFTGAATRVQAAQSTSGSNPTVKAGVMADDSDKGKHDCKGKNDCKGKGGCKGDGTSCKGKNDCKGKGGCNTNKPM
jgi:hypothetical protein